MRIRILALLLCLLLALSACAAPQQPDSIEAALTDKELIYKIADSGAISAMHLSSYRADTVENTMCEFSGDFAELISRESGVESLRQYGPEIAEEYLVFHSAKTKAKGFDLLVLLVELFPDEQMRTTVDDLYAKYQITE